MRRERIQERPATQRRRHDPSDLEPLEAPRAQIPARNRRIAQDLADLLAEIDRVLDPRKEV